MPNIFMERSMGNGSISPKNTVFVLNANLMKNWEMGLMNLLEKERFPMSIIP